jgi:hypothetical protein
MCQPLKIKFIPEATIPIMLAIFTFRFIIPPGYFCLLTSNYKRAGLFCNVKDSENGSHRRGAKEGIKRNLAIDFYRQTQVKRQKQEGKKK